MQLHRHRESNIFCKRSVRHERETFLRDRCLPDWDESCMPFCVIRKQP
jgi:hypothetical protein